MRRPGIRTLPMRLLLPPGVEPSSTVTDRPPLVIRVTQVNGVYDG